MTPLGKVTEFVAVELANVPVKVVVLAAVPGAANCGSTFTQTVVAGLPGTGVLVWAVTTLTGFVVPPGNVTSAVV